MPPPSALRRGAPRYRGSEGAVTDDGVDTHGRMLRREHVIHSAYGRRQGKERSWTIPSVIRCLKPPSWNTVVCDGPVSSLISHVLQDPMIVENNNQGHSLLLLITHPAPGLMLGSCILLGCCLSSFAHRRQDEDRYQAAILIWLALWGAALGKAIGASANMITLGFVPWALCAAMPLSLMGHAVLRRVGRRKKTGAASVAYAPDVSSDEKFLPPG
jgi:hypothetical protein